MASVSRSGSSAPAIGSLVTARGRDWVVLPAQEPDVIQLRPLTGVGEGVGVFLPLERDDIHPSSFEPPDPAKAGDATGASLLLDAARISLRNGATPFRSLGRLSVAPRPYQFVPLIMALRQDPVRLLIADDVGVGKTVEAAMVARELLDRGIARRVVVICPAHLCEQWENELAEKFGIRAAVVQPSRIARLERDLPRQDLSLYQYYPHLIASIDFVKSEHNRGRFLQNAPDLVIVDEAHGATRPRTTGDRVQQQRYELLRALADDPRRHLVLVTATPHSGIEESFRSLLGLLDKQFDTQAPELERRKLVPHIVQRKRSNLVQWLGATTPFPERLKSEERTYKLTPGYRALFDDVLAYCRESVQSGGGLRQQQQRVRHWAAIALLRCVLSSPEAAVAVLSERARRKALNIEDEGVRSGEDVDALYRPQVLDPLDEETIGDYIPTAPLEDAEPLLTDGERRRLSSFLQRARALVGIQNDAKLAEVAAAVGGMLREGFRPIVFCRFIASAKYLEVQLPKVLAERQRLANVRVVAVTGEIGEEERRAKVADLVSESTRVLVATDCLSEGINLQDWFDAVVHFDLPWNPNRLEQREGRVDRFGQRNPKVKVALIYGADNPVDLVVLDVLVRKARTIRDRLGVSVPIPADSERVVQTLVDNVLLRRTDRDRGLQLQFAFETPEVSRLHHAWDEAAEREDKQREYFSQKGIQPDEVARELEATDRVLGDVAAVQRFLANAAQRFGGALGSTRKDGVFDFQPGTLRSRLAARFPADFPLQVTFNRQKDERAVYLGRTHPLVEEVCEAVLGAGLSREGDDRFARAGAIFTHAVQRRTAVVLLRLRYLLLEQVEEFAEEVLLAGFERRDGRLIWLDPLERYGRDLVEQARPAGNMDAMERSSHVEWALDFLQSQPEWFASVVEQRVKRLEDSHARLRSLVQAAALEIQPRTPPDIMGCYVFVPTKGGR